MKSITSTLCAVACGIAFSASAYATEMTPNKKGPSSSNESAPAESAMKKKGKSGEPVIPSKGPSASNESAPAKAYPNKAAPKMDDGPKMANPKSPSASNESAPSKMKK